MGRAVGARAFGVPVSWGVAPGWYRKGLWPEKNPPPNGRLGLNTYAYSKNQVACYHCGIGAGRYVSLERIIEENEERWYEVLERSSQRWHEGQHDPWPALNFLLFILTQACEVFEQRVSQLKSPRGEKTEAVLVAVERQVGTFRVADTEPSPQQSLKGRGGEEGGVGDSEPSLHHFAEERGSGGLAPY